MVGPMMWFKREPKVVAEKVENGVVGKLRRKKAVLLKPTRESSERETSTESEKEKRRYSDILDIKVSQERRDESDESLYESADCHSDAISASDDAIPHLGKTPTMSKESLKLAVTDEEVDFARNKKGHRKTMSLSNPLEIVKTLGDEWFDLTKKELDKHSDKKKSRESLWSEEDRDSIHGSTMKLDDDLRKNSKKEIKSQSSSRKSSTVEPPKSRKSSKSSVSALNFLRRKKTPTSMKTVEAVAEAVDKIISTDELLNYTRMFLEEEKRHSAITVAVPKPPVETDSDEEPPIPKPIGEHRRRLSRQTSRSKSKVRGKSQSLKVNTLRKSHSGTLKKAKKKSVKTPLVGRSRQASVVEQTPILKKKSSDSFKQNSWLFSGRGEPRREGSAEEPAVDVDADHEDPPSGPPPDTHNNWRSPTSGGGRGVNRAESCRERDAPRRGKHRNASDPNRLTAHNHHDLEPGAAVAPSGSSSSSSLSSRSNESNTVAAEQQASASDWSDEEEPLAAQWTDSLPPHLLDSLLLSARLRKRQEVIHELIVSEGSHNRWLRVLGQLFLRPLEAAPAQLPAEELRALFPNLPAVRERHARLYQDLRAIRAHSQDHLVALRPLADAMLATLGEAGYAACLAHFCRGQRWALEALKERRRKNKELHQFLAGREQQPVCGRLQLRDLLACVWQRLTKYQLLLESILKTVNEDSGEESSEEVDSPEDVAQLRRALTVAKDVLHSVDTAIRTAENEHRLRSIQNKLEVRIPGSGAEWDEPRRLDLTARRLRLEGELAVRHDSSKKMSVLALMLEDALVLLQRESDKFVLKPIPQPSQQGLLSPVVRWDKVLFRPNAAVRNTFFLMNINGVQMHELSANTAAEYATWVRHIQELPLAKPELRPALTPSHQPSRSTDDSGINVSRNPSDASEKSTSSAPADDHEPERERVSLERVASERERLSLERTASERERLSLERTASERERVSLERSESERDSERAMTAPPSRHEDSDTHETHKPRRPTVGRISTHGSPPPPPLEPQTALNVTPPAAHSLAHTAERVYTHQERLRRLDLGISRALRAKSAVVGEVLGVPGACLQHLADLAVADTMGDLDLCGELGASEDEQPPADLHQLLLAAQAQANQLTEQVSGALSVGEARLVASRVASAPAGRCDRCRRRPPSTMHDSTDLSSKEHDIPEGEEPRAEPHDAMQRDSSFDMLSDLRDSREPMEPVLDDGSESGVALARRLVAPAAGLQGALGRAVAALPSWLHELQSLRAELAALRDHNDQLRAKLAAATGHPPSDDLSFSKETMDQTIPEQPSNGG